MQQSVIIFENKLRIIKKNMDKQFWSDNMCLYVMSADDKISDFPQSYVVARYNEKKYKFSRLFLIYNFGQNNIEIECDKNCLVKCCCNLSIDAAKCDYIRKQIKTIRRRNKI